MSKWSGRSGRTSCRGSRGKSGRTSYREDGVGGLSLGRGRSKYTSNGVGGVGGPTLAATDYIFSAAFLLMRVSTSLAAPSSPAFVCDSGRPWRGVLPKSIHPPPTPICPCVPSFLPLYPLIQVLPLLLFMSPLRPLRYGTHQ